MSIEQTTAITDAQLRWFTDGYDIVAVKRETKPTHCIPPDMLKLNINHATNYKKSEFKPITDDAFDHLRFDKTVVEANIYDKNGTLVKQNVSYGDLRQFIRNLNTPDDY